MLLLMRGNTCVYVLNRLALACEGEGSASGYQTQQKVEQSTA